MLTRIRHIVLRIALGLTVLCGGLDARAGQSMWRIPMSTIEIYSDGWVLVYSPLPMGDWVGCMNQDIFRFAFDSTTPAGKSMLTTVMAAYLAGRRVELLGAETCHNNTEVLGRVTFAPPS